MTTIRKAKLKDVPEISKLAVELLKYHADIDPYFAPAKNAVDSYSKHFARCVRSSLKQLLIAEVGNKIIGYALVEITFRPPVFKIRDTVLVSDMFVLEEFRKKGVSKKLFAELLDWVKHKKVKYKKLDYIELFVDTQDSVSPKVWKKYGFKEYMSRQRMKL
ncbi:GNAT family N-acetyltransferase [Candidatus Parcubacteria bacterium]|jgi:GNAT superfamily N-acetyltransferase|nr:GNAT family N-acetyltransferase [Candidatus Parcubacteria bacterium]MBT3948592.1 GNAT family N-acetyltransferase [Candidatus Parcubacteria bacterium]